MTTLAISIISCNSERTIRRVLESVAPLKAHIQVVDSGSTDATISICEEFGAHIIHRDWNGPVEQNAFAFDQLKGFSWTLSLDSDEIIDDAMREHIKEVVEDVKCPNDGWEISRKLEFLGEILDHTFQPEWRMRLFRSDLVKVTGMGRNNLGGHNKYEVPGDVGKLRGTCYHASWESVSAMFRSYVRYGARHASYVGTGGSLANVIFNAPHCFFKFFVLKKGFRDGHRGLLVCAAAAMGNLMKHLMVYSNNRLAKEGGEVKEERASL
ncbi:MAG: glycosyltransferase family 2 protein [Verrucomicrobiota bacterium]